jgi:hypothetical protein
MRQSFLIAATLLTLAAPTFAQHAITGATPPKLLPGTHVNVFSTIQGNAINSANMPLPDTVLRLRDARFGRIVDMTTTDKQGGFVFHNIDPGTYVVELMNPSNNVVLASSQILYVSSGEAVSTIVKLPFTMTTLATLLGTTASTGSAVSSAALAVMAAAAASNTVAETLAGAPATVTRAANGR